MPCVFEKVSLWFSGGVSLLLLSAFEATIYAPFAGADVDAAVQHVITKT